MYSYNIVNFQESTTILNPYEKRLETYRMHLVFTYFPMNIKSNSIMTFFTFYWC